MTIFRICVKLLFLPIVLAEVSLSVKLCNSFQAKDCAVFEKILPSAPADLAFGNVGQLKVFPFEKPSDD